MQDGFNVKVWRNYYDQINILGQYYKDSMYDSEGNPPKIRLNEEEKRNLEKDIEHLRKLSNKYLDGVGLKAPVQKWQYLVDDETTHASSEKFQYSHLV